MPQSGGVDGDEIAALLGRWPGMSFFAAPTMVKRLAGDRAIADADLSNLKTIIYGGAPMYLADLEDALAVFGPRLAQIYGQGEAPMTITALSKADHADRNHPRWRDRMQSASASPVPTSRSASSTTAANSPRTRSVRWWSGATWSWPATGTSPMPPPRPCGKAGCTPATSAASTPTGTSRCGTGPRILIISGGMNIYPREVEEALLRHPGVRAAAVVGRPDAKWGEAVVAFVVAADRVAQPSVGDLDRTCLDHIARFKRPKDYRFVDALPTNNYGKVVKRELRDRLRAETADAGRVETRPWPGGCRAWRRGRSSRPLERRPGPCCPRPTWAVGTEEARRPQRWPCKRTVRRPSHEARLYLPNFRDKVTLEELEDLTTSLRSSTSTPSGRSTGSSFRRPLIARSSSIRSA